MNLLLLIVPLHLVIFKDILIQICRQVDESVLANFFEVILKNNNVLQKYYHTEELYLIWRFCFAHFKSLIIPTLVLVFVFGGPKVDVFVGQQRMTVMIS